MSLIFDKIQAITGRKLTECDCDLCKSQCTHAPCLGTPEDIEKIIDAGFGMAIFPTDWGVGVLIGVHDTVIDMYQAAFMDHGCVFYAQGLCLLHNLNLKPTEGRLSHHSHKVDNFVAEKSIGWNVAKEWLDPVNKETIERIKLKMKAYGR